MKAAVDDETAGWLRAEYRVYSHLDGPFVPRLIGWDDDGRHPMLAIEDLSECRWPPPWGQEDVGAVLATLAEVAGTSPPPGLASAESLRDELAGWRKVQDDPAPFMSLGLCTADWLDRSLHSLIAASDAAVLDGDALLHFDVRSDNICLCEGRAKLVDWNSAVVGNSVVDVAAWLPSLCLEGGPDPEEILAKGTGEIAALLSGYWAARAGLPPPARAPRVREVQRAQLSVALPWAARVLGFEEPSGK